MKLNLFALFYICSSVCFSGPLTKEEEKAVEFIFKTVNKDECYIINSSVNLPKLEKGMVICDYQQRMFEHIENDLYAQNTRLNRSKNKLNPGTITIKSRVYFIEEINKYNSRKIKNNDFIKKFKVWRIQICPVSQPIKKFQFVYIENTGNYITKKSISSNVAQKGPFTSALSSCTSTFRFIPPPPLSQPVESISTPNTIEAVEDRNETMSSDSLQQSALEQWSNAEEVCKKIKESLRMGSFSYYIPSIYEGLIIQGFNYQWINEFYISSRDLNIGVKEDLRIFLNVDNRPSMLVRYVSHPSNLENNVIIWLLKMEPNEIYYYVEKFCFSTYSGLNFLDCVEQDTSFINNMFMSP